MNTSDADKSILDVPYYQQSRYATCGPAALMMVMKYYDQSLQLNKSLENKLWKQGRSLRYFGATLPSGLATTAKKHGFEVILHQKYHATQIKPKIPLFTDKTEQAMNVKTKNHGITITYELDQYQVIKDALLKKIPPIALVRLMPIVHENVLHWVVITGISESQVYVNDPYIPIGYNQNSKKNVPISLDIFNQALATDTNKGFRLPPTILTIYK